MGNYFYSCINPCKDIIQDVVLYEKSNENYIKKKEVITSASISVKSINITN